MILKCRECQKEFLGWYPNTVCPECRAIDEPRMKKETEQIADLIVRIENIWREYRNLQDEYHKLTGRDYMWLR